MQPSRLKAYSDINILLLLGLGLFVLHMVLNHQYGFHQDEMVMLDNANHLDRGYIEYPPLTPFLTRVSLILFGSSPTGVRTFSALAFGIVLVLTGLMTRELGGRRTSQVVAALAASIAPVALIHGSMMQYVTFDFLWSVLIAYLVIRLLKSENPRLWLWIGLVIGLGMMTKYTMVMFVAGLVGGILLTEARRYLKSLWLWGGVVLSLLVFIPNLIWQVQHHFISLEFLSSIHSRDVSIGRAQGFLAEQFFSNSNPFLIPFWVAGLYYYFFTENGRRFRTLGWMYLIPFLIYLVTQGRAYYLAPAYPMLIAAGGVLWEHWLGSLSENKAGVLMKTTWGLLVVGAIVSGALTLPIAPINSTLWNITAMTHDAFTEQVGWHEMVKTVGDIYAKLPDEEKKRTGILTGENDEAAAINFFGADRGFPKAISGSDTFWLRGYGDPPPEVLITVGFSKEEIDPLFTQCSLVGTITNSYGVDNDLRHPPDILICRNPSLPWPELWIKLKRYS